MTDKTTDGSIRNSIPFVPSLVQTSTCATPELVRAPSVLKTNSSMPSRTTIIPSTKTPKFRPRPSTPVAGASTARYARAPRGGIPPHIARTVTKANVLLVEKERKVMRDPFSNTTMGDGKKPSVLRRAAKVEKGTSKTVDGISGGEKLFACSKNEKGGRAVKRARV